VTSLRARLLLGLVVLAAIGLTIAGSVTYTSLRSFLYDRVDQQLVNASASVLDQISRPGPAPREAHDIPVGTYAEARAADGTVFATVSSQAAINDPPKFGTTPVGKPFTSGTWRVRIDKIRGSDATLTVAIPLNDARDTLGRLLRVELFVALGVLSGLAALAWWVVKVGLRPLVQMGTTAGAIAAGDLSRRVEPADGRTEVGRLGASLNAMLHQIEGAFAERTASEDRLRRFVADAAHELRTPLTSIRGYSELFRRGASDRPDDLAKSMQRIEAEASRMGVLVDDLLLLARLDQGRPLGHDQVNLTRVAGEVVGDALVAHPDRSISFDAPDDVRIAGDEGRLRQAVQNLVTNAVAHTPTTAAVRVVVGTDDGHAVVDVADTGPGIPADDLPHLFERFYRIDHSRARSQGGGTGLGLSIVAAVAEAHGGTAEVASTLGAGARFRLRLPLLSASAADGPSD
jgi:two-component system OmpR family sensor kinase